MNRIHLNDLRHRLRLNRIVVGTVLLPMILGGLILWSLSDRAERSDRIPTAVVNADKLVHRHGKPVYAGRLLAAELTSPRNEERGSLGWELTDARDAQEGLRDGDYYAVLTIPPGFSRTIAGLQGADPQTAQIQVRTNDSSSALVGEISRQVGDIAANRLGHRITATFVEGFLSQSGVLKEQLGEAASGAGRISAGDYRMADGADRLGDGAKRLQHGLGRLAAGADQLSTGADKLSRGADRLSTGADRLSTGADQMAVGADRLADGMHRTSAGQDRLADGLTKLSRSAHGASGPVQQMDPATLQRLQERMQAASALLGQLQEACANAVLGDGARELCRSVEQVTLGSEDTRQLEAMTTFLAGWPQFVDALDRSAAGARRLATGMDRLEGGARRLSTGASRLATGADRLATGADRLATGADRLSSGADRVAVGAHRAEGGAGKLAAGAYELADGADQLGDGASRLATGLQKGADKIPVPDDPAHQAEVLSDPVDAMSSDTNPVLDGTTLLTPGALALALWLGAFVIYLARRGVPERLRGAAVSPVQLAWAGWWPALVLAGVQTALLLAVPLALGADLASPWGVVGVSLFAAAVFTAINQALVTWLGAPRGWIVSIVFAGLQIVSLGGLLPIDTAPGPIQALNAVLPIARATDALSQLTLGGSVGNVGADVLVLGLWGAAALGATVVAARKRQGTTVAEVRRELAPAT